LPFGVKRAAAAVKAPSSLLKIKWSGAPARSTAAAAALRLHVRDDEVYWVETDNTGEDIYGNHQVRACLRGRSIRRRINHPDRLNYPMKRVGKRGEGKFERISWDEALDTITASLKDVVANTATKRCTSTTLRDCRRQYHPLLPLRFAGGAPDELLRRFPEPLRHLQHGANRLRNALHLRQQRRQQHLGYRKHQTGGDVRQ
jgi:anaerobic selenocysteine-containing dehydrogenase